MKTKSFEDAYKGRFAFFQEFRHLSRMSLFEYLMTLLAMVSVLLVVVIYIFNSFYKVVKVQTLNDGLTNVSIVAERMDYTLTRAVDAINVSSHAIESMKNPTYDELKQFLVSQNQVYNEVIGNSISAIYVSYDTMFVSGDDWLPGNIKLSERPWYKAALKKPGKPVVVRPYIDADTKKWMISVSRSFDDNKGIISVDMHMDVFSKLAQNIQQPGLRKSFIFSDDGFVLASSDSSIVEKNFLGMEHWQNEQANLIKGILQNNRNKSKKNSASASQNFEIRFEGTAKVVFYRTVYDKFFVVLVSDEGELFESVQKILVLSIILSVFLIFVVGAFVTTSFINGAVASRSAREQLKMKKELQKNFDIISTLAGTFDSVCYIDALDGRVYPYSLGKSVQEKVDFHALENMTYDQCFTLMIHSLICENDRIRMEKETKFENVISRLTANKSFDIQYKNIDDKYHKLTFIKSDQSEKISSFVMAIADVDSETRKIQNFQQDLENAKNRAEEANSAKSSFLANMSHEIRTPINAVMGMNEMILRESSEPQIRAYSNDIKGASQVLLSIINDILDFSKIEAGKMDIVETKYDVGSVLNEVSTMIGVKAEQKGLELRTGFDEMIPSLMVGDSVRIQQVMLNLLNNAVKYTEKGFVEFSVNAGTLRMDPKLGRIVDLTIQVKDSGIGIREVDQANLFKSFQRLDLVQNRKIEGTGLGLAITSKLVEFMHGKISVKSIYGKGSIFTVVIPQVVLDSTPIGNFQKIKNLHGTGENDVANEFIAPEAKVLVVDDNSMNLRVATQLLKHTQIKVTCCSSGMECLERIKETRFDIIFLDHMMPGMDGIETLKLSKKMSDSKCLETPVIALTANAIVGAKEMYLKAGFNGYIGKPIKVEEMYKALLKWLPQDLIQFVKATPQDASASTEENSLAKKESAPIATENLPAEESHPLIDSQVGMEYCSNNADFYKEILQMFAESCEENLARMKTDYDGKNWNDLRIVAHTVKGNALMIGSKGLSQMAKSMEFACRDKEVDSIVDLYGKFVALYSEVSEATKKVGLA